MDRDNVDAISEALTELFGELQNTIEQYAIYQLTQYTDTPEKWKSLQLKHQKDFSKALDELIKQFKVKINKPIEIAFNELYKDAKSEVKETREDVKESRETDSNRGLLILPINVNKKIKAFKKQVFGELDMLQKQSNIGFKSIVNNIGKTIIKGKITSGDILYAQIEKAMQKGIKDMFVTYKNGRRVSYKAYMEMNVRTTMHQEALAYQFENARKMGVVFYLASSHGDCADDHAKYQGKLYYDESWQSIAKESEKKAIAEFISRNKLMSIQDVRDGKPYLGTRPNCRHKYKPLTLSQVLNNSVKELLVEHKLIKGKYDSEKYKNLQYQRLLERKVRQAKQDRDNLEIEIKNAKDDVTKKKLQEKLANKKSLVHKNQRELNSLVKDNKYLERDYRRENYKTIVQDVGYKYRNAKSN